MTKSNRALIVLILVGVSGVALADDGTSSDQVWKAGQLKYVECVVSETDKRLGSDEPSMATAHQAVNICDTKLYKLGVDYSRWLRAAGTMAPKDVEAEAIRFARSTRDSARRSMLGNVTVIRQDRDAALARQTGLSNEPLELLAYEVR